MVRLRLQRTGRKKRPSYRIVAADSRAPRDGAIIEIIGHLARPVSLSLRLFGNMYGHEIVLMIFLGLVPFLVPIPMMFLGILVAFIQTFVFTLLAMIYLAGALEEAH